MEVLDLAAFRALVSDKPASAATTQMMTTVPTFVVPEYVDAEVEQVLEDSFAKAVKTVMAGNFFISLLLAGAMQYLWGMVNALQIIVLSSLFSILTPTNSGVIQTEILKATAFDFYHTENLYVKIFGFKETESFSDAFEDAGLSGSNFMIGIGPLFIFCVLFPAYVFV